MEADENIAVQFAINYKHRLCWRKSRRGSLSERQFAWFVYGMGGWFEDQVRAMKFIREFLETVTTEMPELLGTDSSEERAQRILKRAQKHLKIE